MGVIYVLWFYFASVVSRGLRGHQLYADEVIMKCCTVVDNEICNNHQIKCIHIHTCIS